MDVKIYDRQQGERERAYAAFVIYRDLGVDRQLSKAAAEFYGDTPTTQRRHRNINQFSEWCNKYKWVDRCLDYDRDVDRSNRAGFLALKGVETVGIL